MEKALLIVSLATNIALFFIVIAMAKSMINMARFRTNKVKNVTEKLVRLVKTHSYRIERFKTEFKIPRHECEPLFRYAYRHHPYDRLEFKRLPEWIQRLIIKKLADGVAANLKLNSEMIQAQIYVSGESYELIVYTEIYYSLMSPPDHVEFFASVLKDEFPNI